MPDLTGQDVQQQEEHMNEARRNHFEGVSAAEDSFQIIASTTGLPISAKKVSSERRATQALGQLPETLLQQLSKDHRRGDTSQQRPDGPQDRQIETFQGIGRRAI